MDLATQQAICMSIILIGFFAMIVIAAIVRPRGGRKS